MATERYSPLTSTSIEAITITQTLIRIGAPPDTRTFTTTTTLTLSNVRPTGVGGSRSRSHSTHLPPSAVGAIVGSILGFILLLILLFYCCRAPREDIYSDSESSPEPVRYTRPPVPGAGRTDREPAIRSEPIRIEKSVVGVKQQVRPRPRRRRRRPPMNVVHAEPKEPIIPPAAIHWIAGRSYSQRTYAQPHPPNSE